MLRLRLPQLLAGNDLFNVTTKADDDQQMGMMEQLGKSLKAGNNALSGPGNRFKVSATIDWPAYQQQFANIPRAQLYPAIESMLLLAKPTASATGILQKSTDTSTKEKYIQTLSLLVMSTPEYQLC